MKKIIIIAIVLIVSFTTKAQNQIIGKVVEIVKDGSELPIPGANVYWEGTTIGAATQEEGDFSIVEPTAFPATIVVSFVGYQQYTQLIKDNTQLYIYLTPSLELKEVR